jgi:DNA-binding winged helix-turn-helix (wHTH) protein/tetratricopeptide (TPR) repeat protein
MRPELARKRLAYLRIRLLIVSTDIDARAQLVGVVRRAGYAPELAEPAARAHERDTRGIGLAIVVPRGLGAAARPVILGLQARVRRVLVLADGEQPAFPGCETVPPGDEAALLRGIARCLDPGPETVTPAKILRFAEYHLDLAAERLCRGEGEEVRLSQGEFRLLRAFAERPGRVLSREQLLLATKGGDTDSDRGIDMVLVRLRRKIERDPRNPVLIVTVPGSGYRFNVPVQSVAAMPPSAVPADTPAAAAAPIKPPAQPQAARRQLTVLSADLVAMAGHRPAEPEVAAARLAQFRQRAADVAARFGGVAGPCFGRTALLYFGYPNALEHAGEWAVSAGLTLIEAAAEGAGAADPGQAVRVGVAAGLVVTQPDGEIVGEAPDRAIALQARATPGQVLIDAAVRQALGGLFRCSALPGEGQDRAWRALGPRPLQDRFRALRRDQTPLVGRSEDMEILQRRWATARDGAGRVVVITGEAGIGKSRLTRAMAGLASGPGVLQLCLDCTPRHAESALHPLINLLERLAPGDRIDDGAMARKHARLRRALAEAEASDDETAALADLLGLCAPPQPEASPQERKARLFESVMALLVRLCDRRPVLLRCEDVHWADSLSLELLDRICRDVAELPVLLLVTSRTDLARPWIGDPHVTCLRLNRLGRRDAAVLAAEVAAGQTLPADMAERIAEHTDGVPLFVEEVTRTVLESGAPLQTMQRFRFGEPMDIPAALQNTLLVRLDQLGAARALAQCAAAVGHDVTTSLLASVAGLDSAGLDAGLARLTEAGILLRAHAGNGYRFRHALIRDTAYATLTLASRRALHAQIAAVLEAKPEHDAAAHAQQLALHYTAAGLDRQAAAWWLRAGLQSLHRSAMSEALAQLARALDLLDTLAEDSAGSALKLEILVAYGRAITATKGHGADEVAAVFSRARALCARLGDPPQVLTVLFVLWTHSFFRVRLAQAQEQAADLLAQAQKRGEENWLVMGTYALGFTSLLTGRVHEAVALLGEGIRRFDPAQRQRYAGPTVSDPRVVMRTYLGWAHVTRGEFAEGERQIRLAVQEARDLGQIWVLALALSMQITLLLPLHGGPALRACTEELLELSAGSAFWSAVAMVQHGWLLAACGDPQAGLAASVEGRQRQLATGARLHLPYFVVCEADMLLRLGRPAEAQERLALGEQLRIGTGECWDDCEFHRQRGKILHAMGQHAEARAEFLAALRISRERGQHLFALRATLCLADLPGAGRDDPGAGASLQLARAAVEDDPRVIDVAQADRMLLASAVA